MLNDTLDRVLTSLARGLNSPLERDKIYPIPYSYRTLFVKLYQIYYCCI